MNDIYVPKLEQKYNFNEDFKALCKVVMKRVREDYDCVMGITGEEGSSKSTCAHQIGFNTDKNYSLEENVLYSPSKRELEEKIKSLPRFSTIDGDEAIKILDKHLWHQPKQIFLNMFYRMCRQENQISLMVMPRFSEFNEGFRNHRIKIWIHVLDRGIAVVFIKDPSAFAKDPWWFDENQKIIDKYRSGRKLIDLTLEDYKKAYSKSRNFMGIITYPDLLEPLRIRFKELSSQHKYEGMTEEYESQEKFSKFTKFYHQALRFSILEIRKNNPDLSERDIAMKLHMSQPLVNKLLKSNSDSDSNV